MFLHVQGVFRIVGPIVGCLQIGSELILQQDPIILPLTKILTVPVSRKQISTTAHADHNHETMLKKNFFSSRPIIHFTITSFDCPIHISTNMSLLLNLQAEVLDYAKAMPEAGKAEDLDFKV
jgi:hypothetical protein